MDPISILVAVLLFALVYWAIHQLATVFGLSAQILTVIDVFLIIAAVAYLLRAFGLRLG